MGRNAIIKKRSANPKKKQEIIDGLVVFFRSNSLADNNMDQIAEGLNKSKATLYKYFKSKEEMVDAVIDYKVKMITGFVPILHNADIDYIERYSLSFDLLQTHIRDIGNDFLSDIKTMFPGIYQKVMLLVELAVHELSAYYKEGMKRGIFNRLNAKMLSQIDFIFFQTLTDPVYLKENDLTLSEAFRDFYDIRCQGLLRKE